MINEPPSRTFVYTAAADPAGRRGACRRSRSPRSTPTSRRYITHVTPSVPIRVVAVPAFDAATIPDLARPRAARRGGRPRCGTGPSWAGGPAGGARPPRSLGAAQGPARRPSGRPGRGRGGFAARIGPRPCATSATGDRPRSSALAGHRGPDPLSAARLGRPPGALTPDEAREGVARCTGSEELGVQAARIAARCDGLLYRDARATARRSGPAPGGCPGVFARLARPSSKPDERWLPVGVGSVVAVRRRP